MASKDVVRQIRKATRRTFSSEEKIRIGVACPVSDACVDSSLRVDRFQKRMTVSSFPEGTCQPIPERKGGQDFLDATPMRGPR